MFTSSVSSFDRNSILNLLYFRLEEFRDRFKLGKDNSTRKQYEYDNSTSQECNDIMREFESSTFSQVTILRLSEHELSD